MRLRACWFWIVVPVIFLWGAEASTFAAVFPSPPIQRTLAIGNWGEDVFWLQRQLMDLGLMDEATGQYGQITAGAVKELQRANGLQVDGIVGPETLAKLGPTRSPSHYTVQKGDSLYTIAHKCGTSMDELVELNALATTQLQIGQKLRVPHQLTSVIYIVVPGDNLGKIAKTFGVTVNEIVFYNNLTNAALIKPEQELVIPVGPDYGRVL